jgi:hypothetical protein
MLADRPTAGTRFLALETEMTGKPTGEAFHTGKARVREPDSSRYQIRVADQGP